VNILQQLDFARPDPALGVEIDADAEGRQRSGYGFGHGRPAFSRRRVRLPPEPFTNKMNRLHIQIIEENSGRRA
jgi:hypothetical protein